MIPYLIYILLSLFPAKEVVVARIEVRYLTEENYVKSVVTEYNEEFFENNPQYVFDLIFMTCVNTYGYDKAREIINIIEAQALMENNEGKIRKY